MGTPHKHRDLIKAWADGAEIQCRRHNLDWVNLDGGSPSWFPDWEYRIKPQTIKYRLCLDNNNRIHAINSGDTGTLYPVRWITDWIEVEI